MNTENEALQQPQKPEWKLTTALKYGAFWAVIGAALNAICVKLFKSKPEEGEMLAEAISGGLFFGSMGGILGYLQGTRNHAQHPLKVENARLQQKIEDLESDKSFTKALIQEKIDAVKDKDCGCKLRG